MAGDLHGRRLAWYGDSAFGWGGSLLRLFWRSDHGGGWESSTFDDLMEGFGNVRMDLTDGGYVSDASQC
jgi:hypothetical protein